MAVDLTDLVTDLQSEVNAPGQDNFPDASDDDWLTNLRNAFWEVRLDGMLAAWTESEGLVTPAASGGTDLPRDLQQLVILYAGIRIVRNDLRNMNTSFHAVAGPVEFEQEKSAQVLKGILDNLKSRRDLVLLRLSDVGQVPSYYIDALAERDLSIDSRLTFWVR